MSKAEYLKALELAGVNMREAYKLDNSKPWMPPLEVGQCPKMFFRESKLGGMFVWWCTRQRHDGETHQLSCRSWS